MALFSPCASQHAKGTVTPPPSQVWEAKLPADVQVDVQDQLYYYSVGGQPGTAADVPLIRARVPNGKPWHPLEGFNLTTAPLTAATTGSAPCQFLSRSVVGNPSVHRQLFLEFKCTQHVEELPFLLLIFVSICVCFLNVALEGSLQILN